MSESLQRFRRQQGVAFKGFLNNLNVFWVSDVDLCIFDILAGKYRLPTLAGEIEDC